MGCASSKSTKTRCHHCQTPLSPKHLPRSYSVPVHHPASRKGDSYHVVALTSSTLGSLHEDSDDDKVIINNLKNSKNENVYKEVNDDKSREFLTEVLQAKNWSTMIDEKIPKFIPRTPTMTPPGEPETINTWELMEGLDEYSPLRLPNHLDRSFTFHSISTISPYDHLRFHEDDVDSPTIGPPKPKPQLSVIVSPVDQSKVNENGFDSPSIGELKMVRSSENGAEYLLDQPKVNGNDFDEPAIAEIESTDESKVDEPESPIDQSKVNEDIFDSPIVGETKTSLQENSMETPKPQWLQMEDDDIASNLNPIISDFDPEIVSQFRKALEELSPVSTANLKSPERERVPFSRENGFLSQDFIEDKVEDIITPYKAPPYGADKVVIYFTSLRGVRKTYEDCDLVRVILKGFGVRLDERDVSMHYGFREELRELSSEMGCGGGLPRVFIKGRYIGGAEEIKQLNEDGMLEKLVQGCAVMEEGNGYNACAFCGDVRFVPCESCSGSCKIYCEEDGDEWEGEDGVGEFQRCPNCNENGIVRCPVCCY
ncbi:hypothetical protein ACHQM5_030778 [Ranunculus cassubicifolius]